MFFFFFQAEDGIRDLTVTGVQTCALPIYDLVENECLGKPRPGFDDVSDRQLTIRFPDAQRRVTLHRKPRRSSLPDGARPRAPTPAGARRGSAAPVGA